jgi:hypothetical protein
MSSRIGKVKQSILEPDMTVKIALVSALSLVLVNVAMTPAMSNEPAQTTASDPDQAVKCRKVAVTGSLLKKGKVCRTIAEWKKIQANGNRTARAIAESGNICSGGECGRGN